MASLAETPAHPGPSSPPCDSDPQILRLIPSSFYMSARGTCTWSRSSLRFDIKCVQRDAEVRTSGIRLRRWRSYSKSTKLTITVSLGAYPTMTDKSRRWLIRGRTSSLRLVGAVESDVSNESTTQNKISDNDAKSAATRDGRVRETRRES